jgi:hypothetical protein
MYQTDFSQGLSFAAHSRLDRCHCRASLWSPGTGAGQKRTVAVRDVGIDLHRSSSGLMDRAKKDHTDPQRLTSRFCVGGHMGPLLATTYTHTRSHSLSQHSSMYVRISYLSGHTAQFKARPYSIALQLSGLSQPCTSAIHLRNGILVHTCFL